MAELTVTSGTSADGTFSTTGSTVWNAGMTASAGQLSSGRGGTGVAFFAVAGPTVLRTYTFPDASATIARTDAANTFTGVQTFSTPIAVGSVATMTSTVGGGVPTPPNNTTTFLRGDGTFAAPAAGSSTWDTIGAAAGSKTTANGDNAIVYQTAQTTASRISWRFTESAAGTSTGTPVLFQVDTVAASTAIPALFKSRTAEVFRISPTTAQILATNGSSGAPPFSFAGTTGDGLYYSTSAPIGPVITQGGVDTMSFNNSVIKVLNGVNLFAPTVGDFAFSGTYWGFFGGTSRIQSYANGTQTTTFSATNFYPATNGAMGLGLASTGWGSLYLDYTNTATVGAVTINKPSGRVNIAAAGASIVVTNSLVTAASHVNAWASTADATARVTSVVPSAGSFTINTVACTGQTSFDFAVINAD